MEERKLTEKESLELISQMIRNTQMKMEENSGTMFLIWGYLTVFTTMLVWSLLMLTNNYQYQWFWFILPVGGYVATWLFYRKRNRQPRASTYIDRIIGYIWLELGVVGFLLSMISIVTYKYPILFIIVLLMGIGTTLTGLVIRFKPLIFSGIFGQLASMTLLFLSWKFQMPIFAGVFIIMMIIPGHVLNNVAGKKKK